MFKKAGFVFITIMFFTFLSVSATLAKSDKAKPEKNAPLNFEEANGHRGNASQRPEKPEKVRGPHGGPSGQNGRSFMGKLYFFQEDPDPEELIVEDGEEGIPDGEDFTDEENDGLEIAWGKMNYNLMGPYFKFVFNGHGLEPYTEYTLIYYPEPPEAGLVCLGTDVSDKSGNVHMNERLYGICDLPVPGDTNGGAQLYLVLADDVNCDAGEMIQFETASYLIGVNLIVFDDTTCEYEDVPGDGEEDVPGDGEDEEETPVIPY